MPAAPQRFGIVTPVVTLNPRSHAPWEESAGIEELRRLSVAAEQAGFDFLTASEHVAVPISVADVRGSRYYDPLATLGYLAAVTRKILLVTHVVVLPYSHPLAVAKRYGTLDAISAGRLVLGVGVGSLEEEFDLLGVEFAGRGPVYEESLHALRAALSRRKPVFHGKYFDFEDFIIDPHAVQERVPIWLGGRSRRSLRRALEIGDGWTPFGIGADGIEEMLARARASTLWGERSERGEAPLEVVIQPDQLFDVSDTAQADACHALLTRYLRAGVTGFKLRFRSESLDHFVDQLGLFQRNVAERLRGG
jgi:probable F420-dependent oxidoreductase